MSGHMNLAQITYFQILMEKSYFVENDQTTEFIQFSGQNELKWQSAESLTLGINSFPCNICSMYISLN